MQESPRDWAGTRRSRKIGCRHVLQVQQLQSWQLVTSPTSAGCQGQVLRHDTAIEAPPWSLASSTAVCGHVLRRPGCKVWALQGARRIECAGRGRGVVGMQGVRAVQPRGRARVPGSVPRAEALPRWDMAKPKEHLRPREEKWLSPGSARSKAGQKSKGERGRLPGLAHGFGACQAPGSRTKPSAGRLLRACWLFSGILSLP